MTRLVLEAVQWSSLPDIHDVEPVSDADYEVLAEIWQVLVRHKRVMRFGVCLLHRHFDLAEDEVAIENTDVDGRTSTVSVANKSVLSGISHIQTSWRFGEAGSGMDTKCVGQCIYFQGHSRRHVRVPK